MLVQPYLNFDGRCEEALEFYKKALGAEVTMLIRNNEAPESPPPGMLPPGAEKKVLHASLKIGDSTVMASDGHCKGEAKFQGITLNLTLNTVEEADRYFAALSQGGAVQMPLSKTFFSPSFGMLADKFGVNWMIYVFQK
jgi:PhnB protein